MLSEKIFAGVAQLVEQRIRNAQVACSSHVTSSREETTSEGVVSFLFEVT